MEPANSVRQKRIRPGYAEVGEVYSPDMLMPYNEYVASRFFREWAVPQGLCDSVWSVFEKSATSTAGITVLRHERDGRVNETVRDRMALLVPHFRRALGIGKVIDFHKNEASALADAFDGLSAAVYLLAADGRVVHANASGLMLLNEGDILRISEERLMITDPNRDHAMREAYSSATSADVAASVATVPLISHGGEKWVAHMLSLNSGSRKRTGAAYSAVVALFVRKADLDLPVPIETMCKLFRLTPSESRVLAASLRIGVGTEIASVLGIAETTVKTHLQHIFAKTGATRQSDP